MLDCICSLCTPTTALKQRDLHTGTLEYGISSSISILQLKCSGGSRAIAVKETKSNMNEISQIFILPK